MGKKAGFFILLLSSLYLGKVSLVNSSYKEWLNRSNESIVYKDSCASVMAEELWQCYGHNEQLIDYRVKKLRNFFSKYKSPLTKYAYAFVEEADKYGLDWRLLPAISGVESSFGHAIPYGSYNAYGWDNGKYYFDDWEDSISVVTKAMAIHYVAKGAKTVDQIAPIYNPVTPDSWAYKVKYFIKVIDKMPPQLLSTLNLSIDI